MSTVWWVIFLSLIACVGMTIAEWLADWVNRDKR